MSKPSEIQDIMEQYDEKQFEEISVQYGILFDWFQDQYPEGSIKLDVHNDKTKGLLIYTLSVTTGKVMANNQGHFVNKQYLDYRKFTDFNYMSMLKRSIVPNYKKYINIAINKHYKKERDDIAKTISY